MIDAYLYFFDQLQEFFLGSEGDPPLRPGVPLASRLEECFHTLRSSLKVVVIDLGKDDDPQVIFETLNARGEPLLPADLMRNYIFLRAARDGEDQEKLYEEFWKPFDDEFWRAPVAQGRASRPLSDLFMQYFVSSRRCVDIATKHLYVEYKYWIEKEHPFSSARAELATLSRQGADFKRLVAPPEGDTLHPFAAFLRTFELGTAYPFLLAALDSNLAEEDLGDLTRVIESFAVRRAICGLTTKNYNRVFLQMTRALKGGQTTPQRVQDYLVTLVGPSVEWPTDDRFREAWMGKPAYQNAGSARTTHVLRRLNDSIIGSKSESIRIDSPLTVEHLLPQDWLEYWPLSDGSTGMNWQELSTSSEGDPRAVATRRRDELAQTMGNLTILTQALNTAVSNREWTAKREEIRAASLLPINQQLSKIEIWDEESILKRGKDLFERAVELWSRPTP